MGLLIVGPNGAQRLGWKEGLDSLKQGAEARSQWIHSLTTRTLPCTIS